MLGNSFVQYGPYLLLILLGYQLIQISLCISQLEKALILIHIAIYIYIYVYNNIADFDAEQR